MEKKRHDMQWGIIFIVIMLFFVFYVLKINGIFDYTSKYGIEYVQCSKSNDDRDGVFMIDGDNKTTWGLLDRNHVKGEHIDFKFRSQRSFSKIVLFNFSTRINVPVNIYVSRDGVNYELQAITRQVYKDHDDYVFDASCNGAYMRIEYASSTQGNWPITEVVIYE